MSHNLVPITEFPIAEALPDYLDAERIGVNAELIGKIAHWGCFKPNVEIDSYTGQITSHNANIVGMDGGAALMGASGTTEEVPLARHSFQIHKNATKLHTMRALKVEVNMPEVQQRLGENHVDLRDPTPWAKQLDRAISQQMRMASRKHLLSGKGSAHEFGNGLMLGGMTYLLVTMLETLITDDAHPGLGITFACATSVLVDNAIKIISNRSENMPIRDTCLTVMPGYHIDRYAVVEALTRTRRLVRPIK
jgi:hypothetical protein